MGNIDSNEDGGISAEITLQQNFVWDEAEKTIDTVNQIL